MLRSYLFVPGDAEARFAKAFASGADAVIQDLEDAVPLARKADARCLTRASLATATKVHRLVRINARGTPFCWDDLHAVVVPGINGVILPKAEDPATIAAVDWVMSELECARGLKAGSVELIPLIESATGVAAMDAILRAAQRIRRVTFGAVDLSTDLGIEIDSDETQLLHLRWQVVAASRAAGLEPPIDTVFVRIADVEGLTASAIRARMAGFFGKLCIHPSQVEIVNRAFEPTPEEIARAKRIVASVGADAGEAAVAKVDGMMVDRPVVERALRVLALAQSIRT